jgi:hypothetical protein
MNKKNRIKELEEKVKELDDFIFVCLQRLDHLEGKKTPYDMWLEDNGYGDEVPHIEYYRS